MNEIPRIQRIIAVLWPSFLMSGLATILFFTLIDPADLVIQQRSVEVSRLGAYSIGFFLFWMLTAVTCALTCYFNRPCHPDRHSSG
ncbi:MAG TPA: hypothetical protein VLA26_08575 [Gammaproteobacteria bacterium]|nr:hypothetical protein [Gammaproteobacteria bacterium]